MASPPEVDQLDPNDHTHVQKWLDVLEAAFMAKGTPRTHFLRHLSNDPLRSNPPPPPSPHQTANPHRRLLEPFED
jgi:hypothetical protein